MKRFCSGFLRSFITHPTARVLATLNFLLVLGCNPSGGSGMSTFKGRNHSQSNLFTTSGTSATAVPSLSWAALTTIDAGSFAANNDTSTTCMTMLTDGTTHQRGCMQPPSILYSDSRWFIGFTQNYIPETTEGRSSLFAALSLATTKTFGTLGSGLSVIDAGFGQIASPDVTSSSSRSYQFAKFANGDVIAVYWIESVTVGLTLVRTVYATIYDASTETWGTATQLGTTDVLTDLGSDFVYGSNRLTHFCRPSVATSGTSALVAWCEAATATTSSIVTALYVDGSWTTTPGTPDALVSDPPATDLTLPAFHSKYFDLSPLGPTTPDILAGDIFSGSIDVDASTTATASVTATTADVSTGQFKIVTSLDGTVQYCDTMQNAANALLRAAITIPAGNTTLARLGVSIRLPANCATQTGRDTIQADSTQWTLNLSYNQNLSATFRDQAVGATDHKILGFDKFRTPTTTSFPSTTLPSSQENWARSGLVAVAGDGYGNFAMVRSLSSLFLDLADLTASSVYKARRLVGHEYVSGAGWRQRSGASSGYNQPNTQFVSTPPECTNGTSVLPCSVRNPRFLMSDAGQGLVLFYQNQPTPHVTGTSATPNRLWWARYGTASGFGASDGGGSASATILDTDTTCSTDSLDNDVSVCETGSYDISTTDVTSACQTAGEPSTATTIAALNHDVPPIAAAMNAAGQAIVAYNKKAFTGTASSPSCGTIGTFAVVYDGFNGFGDVTQIDSCVDDSSCTRQSMHVQVAIAEDGRAAVVWEEFAPTTPTSDSLKYVYLKTRSTAGVWSSAYLVNDSSSLQNAKDSMMPAVGILSSGELVVSFTYGGVSSSTTRRQYARHYYVH